MNSNDIAIRVENLSKKFTLQHAVKDEHDNDTHELWALKDVSFEIKKGESVGIVGQNGSGKSTLLKILAGVTKPTAGRVEIYGRVASILDIGAGFHPELSGRENVFLNGQLLGFSKKEIQSKFDEIVDFSGIEKFIDEPVKNYSNGMYLRLAFSIMAHLDFDVYLFDEVMSVGDVGFSLKTKAKIDGLTLQNKTVVVVSHSISQLQEQNLFVRLEKGILLSVSYQKEILNQYTEKNILDNNQIIHTSNVTINDFSKYLGFNDLKILKVEFLQENKKEFVSNAPFKLNIEFESNTENEDIDFFFVISNTQNTPYITISPLFVGMKQIKIGKNRYSCNIPPSIFGGQVYSINLSIFSKNSSNINNKPITQLTNLELEELKQKSLKMRNLILFKTNFILNSSDVNTEELNVSQGLFPKFEWKYSN